MSEGDETGANEPRLTIDELVDAMAADHFEKAKKVGVHKYYLWLRDKVSAEYKNSSMVSKSIDTFLLDRYIFHHRHQELPINDSKHMAYIDAFEYTISLLNGQRFVTPPMVDDWRQQ